MLGDEEDALHRPMLKVSPAHQDGAGDHYRRDKNDAGSSAHTTPSFR